MNPPVDPTAAATAVDNVQKALTVASVISHLKNNRIEYLLFIGIVHLLGLSERLLAQLNGVCF